MNGIFTIELGYFMKSKVCIHVCNYSKEPFGRYSTDGDGNGETFRKEYILPALKEAEVVEIYLDGVNDEYGSSFLVEAFANLIRKEGLSADDMSRRIIFKSSDTSLIKEIEYYIKEAINEAHTKILKP